VASTSEHRSKGYHITQLRTVFGTISVQSLRLYQCVCQSDPSDAARTPVSSKCFAFVQTFEQKPKRRLFEVLQSQGHQLDQQITFLSDGADTVRELQLYLNPHAEHLLDWFHVS
jgi:hypothetical protein